MKSMKVKSDMMEVTTNKDGYFPSLTVMSKTIPELADKDVGDECHLCIKVKITGISSDNGGTSIRCDVLAGEYDEESGSDGEYSKEE